MVGAETSGGELRAQAFSDLFTATHKRISAYARRRVDHGRVDDIVSETFLTAWRRFDELPPDPDAQVGWLFRTAEHLVMNTLRSQRRRNLLDQRLTSESANTLTQLSPGDAVTTELLAAFGSLPREDQAILLLASWDGLTTGEISGVLGCSYGAAAARLSRARSRFQAEASDRGVDAR